MSSEASYWTDSDWSKVTLGTTVLPGVWEVEGKVERQIDVKRHKDSDGAHMRDLGYEPGEFTLIGQLVTKAEWVLLLSALKEIHPRKGAKRPLVIVHPAIATLGVEAVLVRGIETPKLEKSGILTVRIHLLEWIPQPKPIKDNVPQPITWSAEQRAANAQVGAVGQWLPGGPLIPLTHTGAPTIAGSYTTVPAPPEAHAPLFLDETELPGQLVMGPSR